MGRVNLLISNTLQPKFIPFTKNANAKVGWLTFLTQASIFTMLYKTYQRSSCIRY